MYPPLYDEEIRNNKQLIWYCCKLFVRALITISPVLPLMFVLGCIDSYLVRSVDSYTWQVVIELVIGLIDGVLWLTALCLLHTRFTGHTMPIMKAVHQSLARYPLILLLMVLYVIAAGILFELMLLIQYVFHFFAGSKFVNYAMLGVMLVFALAYIYINVLCFMSFLILLLEKQTFFSAIKRSVMLVQCGWSKAFLAFAGFFFITMLVLLPDHIGFAQHMSIYQAMSFQVLFAIVLIPYWFTWYLQAFHDLKLCHEYDQLEEEEGAEED